MGLRIVGVGQDAGGDDAVGLHVVRALPKDLGKGTVDIRTLVCPTDLVDWLQEDRNTLLVDAILGDPPGRVVEVTPQELADHAPARVSSHGLGVPEAIALAHILGGSRIAAPLTLFAITIAPPQGPSEGLSPAVAAAIPAAVERILSFIEVHHA